MSIGPPSPNVALVTKLVAKPDEADAVSTFLADAGRLASQEQGTIAWFALPHRHDYLLDRRCVSVRG